MSLRSSTRLESTLTTQRTTMSVRRVHRPSTLAAWVSVVLLAASCSAASDESGVDDTSVTVESAVGEAGTPVSAVEPTAVETSTTAAPTTAPPTTIPVGDAIPGAPAGTSGTRSNPVPTGEIAAVGDGWRIQVLAVTDDATPLVLGENQFNEPPALGKRFTFVSVAVGYFGFDDPANGYDLTIAAVGASSRELDTDCGVIPSELNLYDDIFSGGVVTGNLCFVTEPADAEGLQLYAGTYFDDPVFLAAGQPAGDAIPMSGVRGPQDVAAASSLRIDRAAVGTRVELSRDWAMTVTSPATDITESVLAENQFNETPPVGYRFIGVEVALEYTGNASAAGYDVTINAVSDSNVALSEECGVIPNEVDLYSDIFGGGVVSGTVCFVAPERDLGTVTVYAYADYDSEKSLYFAT